MISLKICRRFLSQRLATYNISNAFINNEWNEEQEKFNVYSPHNKELIGNVTKCNVVDAKQAIVAAKDAFHLFKVNSTIRERCKMLSDLNELIIKHCDDLSYIISLETGKAMTESIAEVYYSASFLEYYSQITRSSYGTIIDMNDNTKRGYLQRQPIGIAGIISPWNFPAAMITRKLAACIAAGCSCVIKPSEETPYSALFIASLIKQLKWPKGLVNVITTDRDGCVEIGKELCSNEMISAISFTGSTQVGKELLKLTSSTVKKASMELGGNAPFIVFPSANLNGAVDGLITNKFRCSGQTCIAANRIYVHHSISDKFIELLRKKIGEKVHVGDPFHPSTTMGCLINQKGKAKVIDLALDAVSNGAQLIDGKSFEEYGQDENSLFLPPTILKNVNESMKVYQEEIFGPLISIIQFDSEDDVIVEANSTRYGLAAYVYSENMGQIHRMNSALDYGIIGINATAVSQADGAFGGFKESGLGREGSIYGLDEYSELKYTCIGNLGDHKHLY
ncbi:hypothetical protein SNEBB_007167 [Seison nebaliae]|nr:hypothetical protein SNEBB_007167 [Seison nebaliae]